MWLRLIIEVVLLALSAISVVSIVRAVPWVQTRVQAKKKPWSCDACLGFWVTLALALVVKYAGRVEPPISLAILPAHGLALIVLSRLRGPELTFPDTHPPAQESGSWPAGGIRGDR